MERYQYIRTSKGIEQIKFSCIAISEILKMSIPIEYQKSLMHNMIWKISGAEGKNKTRYCSQAALESSEAIEHEHVFTIDSIKERFITKRDDFDTTVSLIISCLVTKSEHKEITTIEKSILGWKRYKKIGDGKIKIFDMSFEEPKECDIDELINEYKY